MAMVPTEAAIFDLDKTVISRAAMVAFARPLYATGMISRRLVVQAAWRNLIFTKVGASEERMRRYRESGLEIVRGWDASRVEEIVRETLPEVIAPYVYPEARQLIADHQRAGRRVFLISASPREIIVPMAEFLGITDFICSEAEIDPAGRYTGRAVSWAHGPHKAEAMRGVVARHAIDLDASYAYSDAVTDLPMLEMVGHPVAVNPERALTKVARTRGWEIRRFRLDAPDVSPAPART
ncbi:MAG: HAD-superfamily subfamily hydrolase [Acidimicrobiales bacterium]|nr:HAD-superfamily subfamily hydrolase [Acidimicrobiales bacterium]